MEDGQCLFATWGKAAISAGIHHLYGTNFLGVHVLLVVCDAVLWDVGRS